MVYRLDVILEDGARRRASYDTDKPQIIEIRSGRRTSC